MINTTLEPDILVPYQDKMTNSEAAAYLGISPTTLNIWRSKKTINIPYYKIGNRIFYTLSDLVKFVSNQRIVG